MSQDFTEYHVRRNVFYWSPKAYQERIEVKQRRQEAQKHYIQAKVLGLLSATPSVGVLEPLF